MNHSVFIKVLLSVPVILCALYFIPFLGVILLLTRFFLFKISNYKISILLIFIGLLMLIPRGLQLLFNYISFSQNIKDLIDKIVTTDIYKHMIGYSKLLITIGVLSILIVYILKILYRKASGTFWQYLNNQEKKHNEIIKQNDLLMKERKEQAQNTHLVTCASCGADTLLTSSVGTCKYCRRPLEYKEEK